MRSRKSGVITLIIGLIAFMNVARQPRFEAFHTVDVLSLLAAGMCLGVSLVALTGKLNSRGDR